MMDTTFWMSFCDPDRPEGQQFLGVALVDADSLPEAMTRSWMAGCNPGGEVKSVEIPHETIPDDKRVTFLGAPRDTLMSRVELERLGLLP